MVPLEQPLISSGRSVHMHTHAGINTHEDSYTSTQAVTHKECHCEFYCPEQHRERLVASLFVWHSSDTWGHMSWIHPVLLLLLTGNVLNMSRASISLSSCWVVVATLSEMLPGAGESSVLFLLCGSNWRDGPCSPHG